VWRDVSKYVDLHWGLALSRPPVRPSSTQNEETLLQEPPGRPTLVPLGDAKGFAKSIVPKRGEISSGHIITVNGKALEALRKGRNKAMMRRCLLAAALMHQAAAELLCERTGACTRDREEENSILLHTRLYKANVSKHVMKMMNFERPPQDYTFDQYVKDFGKKYDPKSGEYAEREQAFKEALSAVQAHNADASKTYKVAINVYSDWTAE
ncbi:Actinidain, partial [Symbiodinium microadriaticum]